MGRPAVAARRGEPTPSVLLTPVSAPGPSRAMWALLVCQGCAIWLQAVAVDVARQPDTGGAVALAVVSLALTYASVLWVLTRPVLTRAERNAAVICLGVTTTVLFRLKNPLFLVGFDEQLHLRTLRDIQTSHGVFQTNPVLPVSSHYPGLEALTSVLTQAGLSASIATVVVVLVARIVLVTVLCDAVENATGSARAGGVAVAVYAVCDQFVVFMSQYAYQTLALPLALAAVSLTARARWARRPGVLLAGAAVCLLAVVVTHHVTNLLTVAFLVLWALFQRDGVARKRVLLVAVTAVLLTSVWMTIQWSRLQEYFQPMVEYTTLLIVGKQRRELFADSAGDATPVWEQAFLLYYAGAVCLVVLWLLWNCAALMLRPNSPVTSKRSSILLVGIVAMIPPMLAARVLPNSGETIARAPGFLFLPLSLLVAAALLHRYRRSRRHRTGTGPVIRVLGIAIASGVFVGGFLLGSGPGWLRLPGEYLVSADSRSMDAEALTASRWADDNIPQGSRIAADRVSSVLLASQADLWPVSEVGESSVSALFFADRWTDEQTELAHRLRVRYLYVDSRLAEGLPKVGSYFLTVRSQDAGRQLTRHQLSKFDAVPGIDAIYRSDVITIYDLHGLGGGEMRTGYFGSATPPNIAAQTLIGLLLGLCLAYAPRTAVARYARSTFRSFLVPAGASLTFAMALSAVTAMAVALLFAHVWVGPVFFLCVVVVPGVVHRRRIASMTSAAAQRISCGWMVTGAVVTLLTFGGFAIAAASALSAGVG